MKYQIIPREEIKKFWEIDPYTELAEWYRLYEDGTAYPIDGDGHAHFVGCEFPYEPDKFPVQE